MMIIVRTEADLQALMRPQSVIHPFRKPEFRLALMHLRTDENAAWQDRLESFRTRCGCTAGAIGLLLYVLSSVIYLVGILSGRLPGAALNRESTAWMSVLFFVGLVASALIGKLLGLSFAAFRFHQTCRTLRVRIMNA
jgi:hypothetical protein